MAPVDSAHPSAPSPTTAPDVTTAVEATTEATCLEILSLLLPYRRTLDTDAAEADRPAAFPEQLGQLAAFVAVGEPVLFTLPGFPCKSPNPAKVLGHLPDEGERLSLSFLDGICAAVGSVYAPGARILICSDGHVFGDLIRVPDAHIDEYNDALLAMMRSENLTHLDTFDLRAVFGDKDHDEKRALVHDRYAPTLEALRKEVRADEDTLRLYRGITRFLVEDTSDHTGTRSSLQTECRARAYGVIQRSRAWGDLIADHHPRSFRLSIHPQPRGSAKFGIRLLDARDAWTTPWHSSALRRPCGSWELMRRSDAERLGRLVLREGRPSHFEALTPDSTPPSGHPSTAPSAHP